MSNLNREDELTAKPSPGSRLQMRIAVAWLLLAALATAALFFRHRNVSLDSDYQGWASASCMLMAKAFNQLGIWHSHFVPFQNNLPIGTDPDVYLHWPPLYPIVLSWFLRLLGDSPASGRMLQLAIVLVSAIFVWLIGQRLYTPRIGVLAAFFFLAGRATFEGASAILQQPLALLFALVSVYCFFRTICGTGDEASSQPGSILYAILGGIATTLAILSAWDPVFIPFGLLVAALYMRHRRAAWLAAIYCFVAVATFAGVQLLYFLSYPKLFANQFATIVYRAGLSFRGEHGIHLSNIVDIVHYEEQFGIFASWWRAMRNVELMFSSIMLAAALIFVALWWRDGKREDRAATWALGGLFLPVVVWLAVMRNYIAFHSFPLVLAAPFIAIASGFVLDRLWTRYSIASADRPLLWTLLIGVPLLVVHPLLIQYREAKVLPKPEFSSMSAIIRDRTPEGAIVLTPTESLVPVYYSQRHIVRGINSEAWLKWAIPEARRQFPGAPLFFAVRDKDRSSLTAPPEGFKNGIRLGDTVLYEVQ
jgi:hypothetical protein